MTVDSPVEVSRVECSRNASNISSELVEKKLRKRPDN